MFKEIRIEIKWGILFSVMTLLWLTLEKVSGLHDEHIDKHYLYTNFMAIPAVAIYVIALFDKRKNHYGGKMSYGKGLISGLLITLVVAFLAPLVQCIFSYWISPNYFQNAIALTVSKGYDTLENAQIMFNIQNYMIFGVIGSILMGAITSAIVALFTIKK